jgi:glycine cleavage system protein P-like pyridoxal-binding family
MVIREQQNPSAHIIPLSFVNYTSHYHVMASELEARVPMVAGWKENSKDLTAGAAGEIAQVLIGEHQLKLG